MTRENTVQLELTVTLPDSLAREAEAHGLLTPQDWKPCSGQKCGAAGSRICLKRLIGSLPYRWRHSLRQK